MSELRPEIGVVHLHLAPPAQWKVVDTETLGHSVERRPARLERIVLSSDVVDQVDGATAGTLGDRRRTSGLATGVLLDLLATTRPFEQAHEALGIAGEVGEHVAHRPSVEQRGGTRIVVGEICDGALESTMGLGHTGHDLVHGRKRNRSRPVAVCPRMPTDAAPQPTRQIAMVGLGRMGANMARRLQRAGVRCVAHDVDPAVVSAMETEGFEGARTPEEVVAALTPPRHIWLMVPAAFVAETVERFLPLLSPGDCLIDGGNSWYREAVDRAEELAARGIHYLDVGTSGGVFGLERGYCLMVGGEHEAVTRLSVVFDALAPGADTAPRTDGRSGATAPEEKGWLHCGPSGAGHFVKMVHNGIEYGMMAAYAEGLNVLAKAGIGNEARATDAETAPLADARYYRYDLDLAAVTELWRRGSVVTSWLLDLTAAALHADPQLDGYRGRVSDSGEGRWTIHAAVDEGVPVPTLAASLWDRFYSRDRGDVAHKLLSAMRAGFGGHREVRG